MADISKINAVALADIAKLDAVLAANIAKVNGLVFTAAAGAFLLDTYTGAAAGYSTRRLATSATNLMRIREDAGDTETDIGYDSNNQLDTAAIATHCGTANGYVVTWYDQAGSNNATQGTEASQPQIYDGTSVITENGKAAVKFDGTNDEFDISYSGLNINSLSVSTVYHDAVGGGDRMHFTLNNGSNQQYWHYVQAGTERFWYGGDSSMNFGTSNTDQHLGMFIAGSTSGAARFYRDGTEASTSATLVSGVVNTAEQKLGNFYTGNFWWNGTTQEFIVWGADQYNNRTGIETDINSEYLIYQPTDTPTSGLLATYTGAAAAYSVRQLADTAVIAITVRRDSDDEEKRFGFDANGDLDTAGITSFCGTANGYVSQWWDQSTNGNHASQGTQASQPQIYNGTAVITENGKPALEFDGSDDGLTLSSLTYGNALSIISVYNQTDDLRGRIWCDDITGQQGYWILFGAETQFGGFDQRKFYFNDGTGFDSKLHQNAPINQQNLLNVFFTSSQMIDSLNGNAQTQSITGFSPPIDLSGSSAGFAIANSGNMTQAAAMKGQEFILYHSDESSNRTGIETDINDYFSIY